MFRATYERKKAELKIEKGTKMLDRMRRERLLPPGDELDKVSRYEAHLDRSLYKAMHELQRLQAAGKGQSVPLPLAVDLNLDANIGEAA